MIREVMTPYDFGNRRDGITDEGDIICLPTESDEEGAPNVDYDELAERDSGPLITVEQGPSVSLAERAMALAALGRAYAAVARAEGLQKTSETEEGRRALARRYRDVDALVARALSKAGHQAASAERTHFSVLSARDELIAAGFDRRDVLRDESELIDEVRGVIGPDAGGVARRKVLKKVYNPENKK
jgi:hypothetical protein